MFRRHLSIYSLTIILIFSGLAFLWSDVGQSYAQSNSSWSLYQRVQDYADDTLPPYFIVDQSQTVHAFTSQWVGTRNRQLAIVYRQWIPDTGWTVPVDILLSPLSQARLTGVYLDPNGIVHLIFFGGDDLGANIYYSYAPVANAGSTTAWSKPVLIGSRAITPTSAALASDDQGNIIVLYSGDLEGNGLYAVSSHDSGKSWSDPESIFLTFDEGLVPFSIRLSLGETGLIYASWIIVDSSGYNQGSYYAHLDINDWKWIEPIEFAQSVGTVGIANPEIIEHKGIVLVVYNDGTPPTGSPATQWMVISKDEGLNWSIPIRAFARHQGRNGFTSFVVDSRNDLHIIFADRIPFIDAGGYHAVGGIFHSQWTGTGWSEPEAIASRSYAANDPVEDVARSSICSF